MYELNSRVRYSETDREGKLSLSALFDYLQDCCTFQSEELGVGVEYLQSNHAAWVLSSWEVRVHRLPKLNEEIQVCTWPYDFKGFYGYRNFLMLGADGEILVEANSVWVYMDMEKMRPMRISELVKEKYRPAIEEAIGGTWADRKIALTQTGVSYAPVQVVRAYIDTNQHMNNAKYIFAAQEYLPEDFVVESVRAEYKKAAVLGDMLYPWVAEEENGVTVVWKDEQDAIYATVCFTGKGGQN